MLVTIPTGFYRDHYERDLPTPPILAKRAGCYLIDTNDAAFAELVADAKFYADPYGPDRPGMRTAAKALLRAIEQRQRGA